MEKVRKAANVLEKEIRMMRLRFWGDLVLKIFLVGLLVYAFTSDEIIIIDRNGNVSSGRKEDRSNSEILHIESASHVSMLYSTFWTFTHLNYKQQADKGARLGGVAIENQYKSLEKKGFYSDIFRNNYTVTSVVDSIPFSEFRVEGDKIFLRAYGKQVLENSYVTLIKKLDMAVELKLTQRVLNDNPHGLSIEYVEIISNNVIESLSK